MVPQSDALQHNILHYIVSLHRSLHTPLGGGSFIHISILEAGDIATLRRKLDGCARETHSCMPRFRHKRERYNVSVPVTVTPSSGSLPFRTMYPWPTTIPQSLGTPRPSIIGGFGVN